MLLNKKHCLKLIVLYLEEPIPDIMLYALPKTGMQYTMTAKSTSASLLLRQ